jgi:multidrug efflux pump subunit AcrB
VPLLAFAKIHYDLEQPIVWRRDRMPTITVRASMIEARTVMVGIRSRRQTIGCSRS